MLLRISANSQVMPMRAIDYSGRNATIELSVNELRLVANALNETCNGIDVPEFATRMGATMNEATRLLSELGEVIDEIGTGR